MPAATEARKAADKLDNAYQDFAHQNGEDYGQPDWHGAYEYREDGYAIAEAAFLLPVEEREDHVENAVEGCDEHARYLIACAASFRLAELEAAPVVRAAA